MSLAQPAKQIEKSESEFLDVRGLQPPANILAILQRVTALSSGHSLEIRADSNPMQLYDLLQQRGFLLKMERQADGTFHGRILSREPGPSQE